MNPDVRWSALQTGEKLTLPGGVSSGESHSKSHHSELKVHGGGHYTVREDDNDWTIAAKTGITLKVLHRLNPNTHWDRIHPGQKLVVPGDVASRANTHRIRTRYAQINSDDVTLRDGPGTDNDSITTVDEGTKARVLDRENGWYKLRFPKGTVAWVRSDYLTAYHETASSSRSSHHYAYSSRRRRHGHTPEVVSSLTEMGDSAVLQDAYSMRGTRYGYGHASRGVTDCSGFTSQVYARHGVHLPRTAAEQSGVGQRVGKGSLKKGDLVFFHTGRSQRVNHVGMYIGNGKFIHASSGGGKVQVNSLGDGYYSRRFVGARRVAKSGSKK
jgi:cell wall-associated NlpC family hydrolase